MQFLMKRLTFKKLKINFYWINEIKTISSAEVDWVRAFVLFILIMNFTDKYK